MFLKLRVPFFADFDKKTLRPVMERMLCNFYKKHTTVCKMGDEAEYMMIVIDGELAAYKGVDHEELSNKDLVPS
jgi:CRP-like cAMP-binding protein